MNPSLGYQCLSLIAWGEEQPNSVFTFAFLFGCLCNSVVAICEFGSIFISPFLLWCWWDPFTKSAPSLTHWGCNFMRWRALIILLDFWQSCGFSASLRCIKLYHRVAFYFKKLFPFFVILTKLVLLYFISQTSLELFSLQAWKCITKFLPF